MHQFTDRCWVEVDLDAICENYRTLNSLLAPGTQMMAMAKGAAYGMGMLPAIRALAAQGCRHFATASFREAHELRRDGIEGMILVLGPIDDTEVLQALAENITVTVNSMETALRYSALIPAGKALTVHIKLDTGMGRIGLRCVEDTEWALREILAIAKLPGLAVEGLFTHLCDAYNGLDRSYTEEQIVLFRRMVERCREAGLTLPLCHCANSAGAIDFPEAHMDMVRFGASLYGMFGGVDERVPLRHPLSFRTRILQLTDYPAGVPLGYNRTFVTPRPMKVAVAAVGNADGYYRYHSNRGVMLCKGQLVNVLGIVAMDMVLLDVSDIPDLCCGDTVTIIGEDNGAYLSPYDSACNPPDTLEHEIYNSIPPRVPRYYIEGGEVKYRLRYQPVIEAF